MSYMAFKFKISLTWDGKRLLRSPVHFREVSHQQNPPFYYSVQLLTSEPEESSHTCLALNHGSISVSMTYSDGQGWGVLRSRRQKSFITPSTRSVGQEMSSMPAVMRIVGCKLNVESGSKCNWRECFDCSLVKTSKNRFWTWLGGITKDWVWDLLHALALTHNSTQRNYLHLYLPTVLIF